MFRTASSISAVDVPVNRNRSAIMPRGEKSAYTSKQKRQARHIEEGSRAAAWRR